MDRTILPMNGRHPVLHFARLSVISGSGSGSAINVKQLVPHVVFDEVGPEYHSVVVVELYDVPQLGSIYF